MATENSNTRRCRLSGKLRAVGCTGSPLPLAELLRLLQSIGFSPTDGTSKRIACPPVILSCSLCRKGFQRPAFQVFKAMRLNCVDTYCSEECSRNDHSMKNRRKCKTCSSPVIKKTRGYCEQCRQPSQGRQAIHEARVIPCETCNVPFRSIWRGDGQFAKYCCRFCANTGHSKRMSGVGNPKWKNGATPGREQPHSARSFRLMKIHVLKRDISACVVCKSEKSPHVHHIDENPMNNMASNLVVLCSSCHRSWHKAKDSSPSRILWPWLKDYASRPLFTTSKSKETETSSPTESSSTTASSSMIRIRTGRKPIHPLSGSGCGTGGEARRGRDLSREGSR